MAKFLRFFPLFLYTQWCWADPVLLTADSSDHQKSVVFANDNLQVELKDVQGRDVRVFLEDGADDQQIMQSLLQVYTARHLFARSIEVAHPKNEWSLSSAISSELLEKWYAVAGAQVVIKAGEPQNLSRTYPQPALWPQKQSYCAAQDLSFEFPFHVDVQDCVTLNLKQTVAFVELRGLLAKDIFQALIEAFSFHQAGLYVHVIAPYLPYARSDKLYRQDGVVAQGRMIADLFSVSGVSVVTTVRPHSDQLVGFYDMPMLVVQNTQVIADALKKENVEVVLAPDAGFQKEASRIADHMGVRSISLQKKRGIEGDIKSMSEVHHSMDGLRVAVVDDETCSGKTLALSAQSLKKKGALFVMAVVTHLTGPARAALESDAIDLLMVSNTVPVQDAVAKHPKVKIIDMNPTIVRYIYRHFPLALDVFTLR